MGGEGYGGQTVRQVKAKKQSRCGREKTTGVHQQVGPGLGREGGVVVVGGEVGGGRGSGVRAHKTWSRWDEEEGKGGIWVGTGGEGGGGV